MHFFSFLIALLYIYYCLASHRTSLSIQFYTSLLYIYRTCKSYKKLKPPIERVVGRYYEEKGGQMKEIVDCVYDVDLLNSLQNLLTMSTVRDQVHDTSYTISGVHLEILEILQFK